MEIINNTAKIKFISKNVVSFDKIIKHELIIKNDIYEKYNATTTITPFSLKNGTPD